MQSDGTYESKGVGNMRYRCEVMGEELFASSIWDMGKMLETISCIREGDIIPVYIATGNSGQIFCKMICHEGAIYRMTDYRDKVLKHKSRQIPILDSHEAIQ